jgi:hypothetical protein
MEKDLRPDERWAQAIIPRRCPAEETAAPERRSTRSFGEYAFLEDSRYASQPKNVPSRIRRGWAVRAFEPAAVRQQSENPRARAR